MGRGLDGGDLGERRREAAGGGGVVECHNSPIPAEVDPGAKQPLAVCRSHPHPCEKLAVTVTVAALSQRDAEKEHVNRQ